MLEPNSPVTPALNVLIVDDEQDACTNLEDLLSGQSAATVQILGVAHNTMEAEKQITLLQPDALFLDIDMPGEDAFQFLERLEHPAFEVVFVTAYDEYAIRAFRLNAVDYILKPAGLAEIGDAVDKLSARIRYRNLLEAQARPYENLSEQLSRRTPPDKIYLKEQQTTEVVAFTDILYVEARGSYSRIVFQSGVTEKQVVMSHAIAMYEELFPKDFFYRIHKSYLINCRYIGKITGGENPIVLLKNKLTLPVSRRRYPAMMSFLRTNNLP